MSKYLNFPTNCTIVLLGAQPVAVTSSALLCEQSWFSEETQCVRFTMGVELGMVSAFVCHHSESGKERERESVFYYKGTTGGNAVMYNK